jgi:MFS family permease
MHGYLRILGGQFVSTLGSALTGFALGVWVYQQTGSVSLFGLVVTAATLPELLVLPFTGAIVDRHDRRRVILAADTLAALSTGSVALLLFAGGLRIWMIPILVALGAVAGGFQSVAFQASIRQLVPTSLLGRASGFEHTLKALALSISPALAGFLLETIGIAGIVAVDLATYLVAAATVMSVRFPPLAAEPAARETTLLRETAAGWRYLRERPGLVRLMVVFGCTQFLIAFTTLLYTPLILAFSSPATLGVVMSTGAVGLLLGGLAVTWRGLPRRKIPTMMGGLFVGGLLLAAGGLVPSATWIASILFVAMILVPISKGAAGVLWQLKLAPGVQGRVFALHRLVARSVAPVAYSVAGPLADRVFEPLLREGGALADSVGRLIGTGQGRGVALLLILTGLTTSALAVVAYANPVIRRVEREVPDAPSPLRVPVEERATASGAR